jgi:hypothetical protein
MKTPVGVAAAGMIIPQYVLTIPSDETTRYIGINITWSGIIIIASVKTKRPSRPRKLYFANPYAAMELISKVKAVATTVTITLLLK